MLPQSLCKIAFRVSLSLGLVCGSVHGYGQEEPKVNFSLRVSGVAIPSSQDESATKAATVNTQPASFRTNTPPLVSTQSTEARQPIVLPPLYAPNLVLDGKLPDDLVEGRLPPMQSLPYGPDRTYGLLSFEKTWTAPVFCHQPLYFEDTMLERHGHERFPMLTPMISGARFYTSIFTMPYLAYLRRPLQDYPSTGHFRPGSAAPAIRERAPYDKNALRFQILTTGAAFVAAQP